MNTTDPRSRKSLLSFSLTALLAVVAATAQVAIGATGLQGIDNSGSFQQELQACMSGRTQQDQATCLREARNAQADKRRGVLDTQGDLGANAMARCEVFTASEDKAACQARIMGYGSLDGSVAAGGVLREVETVVLPRGTGTVMVAPRTREPVVVIQK